MKQIALFLVSGVLLSAQVLPPLGGGGYGSRADVRRAEIRGGGGNGKCTIEVDVDGTAEVAILGDEARLRTLSGNPARWVRFQCNQRMPLQPNDFRFKGIDGRGRQDLVQPAGGGRPAVIRIDDPKGGSEGYTFDVEWRGGTDSGYSSGGGWGDFDDGSMRRRGNRRNDGWNDNGNWNRNNNAWNREMSFRGRGDGYFRTGSGANDRLDNVDVNISRNGDVRASFRTDRRYDLTLNGRVTNVDRDLILADVSGPGIRGVMEIRVDGNRVRDVFMRSGGRDSAELRWNSRN